MQRDRKQTSGCPGLVVGGCAQMAVTAQWVQGFLLLWWKCSVLDGVVVSQNWECTKCRWIGHLQMDIFLLWPSSHNMHVYQIILNFYNAVCQLLLRFSCSVMSDSLRPHGLQHASPTVCSNYLPQFAQTHVHWVGDAIQPSHPLSSPSPPAFSLSQHQGLFQWVSSSHQVAKVL